jgi:branched-chain amino acid transport system ATP-binding protein
MMPVLEIENLDSGYGEVQILRDVSLSLEKGKLTALVGGNGVGKTTLLRTVMGTVRPWRGAIRFKGEDISRLPAFKKPGLGLVLVPEGRKLFTDMTVYENLEMGATNSRARPHVERNIERVFALFPRLEERRTQQAGTLSGGEQQMLAVARGVMAEPEVLMFDELSLGLAPVLVLQLFETLQQLKASGLTMLLVEQNVHMALSISDDAYVLTEGAITLSGTAAEVAGHEQVRASYLGV